ncbi:serine hydrolase [Brevibacillus daliensis]|uniref:serine hydrolase n=1 Tax=Brevibacillus daliensis TaxID=2892995 RepID=UPI001E3A51AF|nr:serine hydrolase [Brevibacillus daliensis]
MKKIIEKVKEIDSNDVGIIVFSHKKQSIISSYNEDITVPLASSAMLALGFCVAKWVEETLLSWDDKVDNITFHPKEDSKEKYPHLQQRTTLALRDAVEVMIACHDSFLANSVVQFCGGWDKINNQLKLYFSHINITNNPRDSENTGQLKQMFELLHSIFQGYKATPDLWIPIINGLVRQQASIGEIPEHYVNHMTGGLKNLVIDIGIIGEFSQNPLLYVLGANNLPDRSNNQIADNKIIEAIIYLYEEYKNQETVT